MKTAHVTILFPMEISFNSLEFLIEDEFGDDRDLKNYIDYKFKKYKRYGCKISYNFIEDIDSNLIKLPNIEKIAWDEFIEKYYQLDNYQLFNF